MWIKGLSRCIQSISRWVGLPRLALLSLVTVEHACCEVQGNFLLILYAQFAATSEYHAYFATVWFIKRMRLKKQKKTTLVNVDALFHVGSGLRSIDR